MIRNRKLKTLAAALLLCFSPTVGHSTAIVLVRTQGRVTIAAEQLTREVGEKGKPDKVYMERKIHSVGSYWYAPAGLSSAPTGYTIEGLVRDAFRTPGGLAKKVAAFERAAPASLSAAFIWLRDCEPEQFRAKQFQTESTALTVVFAGVENGKPLAIASDVLIADARTLAMKIERDDKAPGPNDASFYFGGQRQVMLDYWIANGEMLANADRAEAARLAIGHAIKVKPESCGGPIDVLELTATGARWLKNN